jgi:hypothetical protein
MALKPTTLATNGSGLRKYPSWIDAFVEYTGKFLESGEIFRRWGAISALAATLEQKVWIDTGNRLYPNLYVFLVGSAGAGKSRVIDNVIEIVKTVPQFHLAPSSMSKASMTDMMEESIRRLVHPTDEYYTMYAAIDELTILMTKFENDIVAALTKFYDCTMFKEAKRMEALRHDLPRPQLNFLTGCTPESLLTVVPPVAWGQGFMSRVILIHTEKQDFKDILGVTRPPMEGDIIHDLLIISEVRGEIHWTDEYQETLHNWRKGGCAPVPQHPYLKDYVARRTSHLLKLSMVACIDRGGPLELNGNDFERAKGWLLEAEAMMPAIFAQGMVTADSRAFDEIEDFVRRNGRVSKEKLVRFISQRVRANDIRNTIDTMIWAGRVKMTEEDPPMFEAPLHTQ